MRTLLLWCSENPWMRVHVPRWRFAQRAVRRFMPGETLAEALGEAARFHAQGVGTVVTQLGENLTDTAQARRVAAHYRDVLDEIARQGLDVEPSVKLTQLGMDEDDAVAEEHLRAIAGHAAGRMVWVDMEQSRYAERTLALYRRVRADHPNVGLCVQAYLRRTEQDVRALLPLTPALRIVKGAYAEPPDVAFPRKADVDEAFFRLATLLLDADVLASGVRPAFATHDLALIQRIAQHVAAQGLPPSACEIQMLYGIRTDAQQQIAAAGHRLRVLISYGSAWYPWYVRRLAERPANLWFVARSLWVR